LALHDWQTAERLVREGLTTHGALHLMAKRGDVEATQWLLAHGADPNGRWAHWDSELTPLHLAVLADHAGVVRTLIDAGADPTIRDSKHDSDAIGWAEFFGRRNLVDLLKKKT
jgi:ankyrin repeat protein